MKNIEDLINKKDIENAEYINPENKEKLNNVLSDLSEVYVDDIVALHNGKFKYMEVVQDMTNTIKERIEDLCMELKEDIIVEDI